VEIKPVNARKDGKILAILSTKLSGANLCCDVTFVSRDPKILTKAFITYVCPLLEHPFGRRIYCL